MSEEQQLTLFSSSYIPPIVTSDATIEGDVVEGNIEEYGKEREKEYTEFMKGLKEDVYQEFRKKYDEGGVKPSEITFAKLKARHKKEQDRISVEQNASGQSAYDFEQGKKYTTKKDFDVDEQVKAFDDYWTEYQVKRKERMRPDEYQMELDLGGFDTNIDDLKRNPGLESFLSGGIEALSFGGLTYEKLKTGNYNSRIYGDDIKSNQAALYGVGMLLGEVTSIAALSLVGGTLFRSAQTIPQVGKAIKSLKQAKVLNTYLKAVGTPARVAKTLTGAADIGMYLSKGASRGAIAAELGAASTFQGFMIGLKNATSASVRNRMKEDMLEENEWKKYVEEDPIREFGKGFMLGNGYNFINSPASLGSRIFLDAAWNGAAQAMRIAEGTQETWSLGDFAYDMALGFAVGERNVYLKNIGNAMKTQVAKVGYGEASAKLKDFNLSKEVYEVVSKNYKRVDQLKLPGQTKLDKQEIALGVSLIETDKKSKGATLSADNIDEYIKAFAKAQDLKRPLYAILENRSLIQMTDTKANLDHRTSGYERYIDDIFDIPFLKAPENKLKPQDMASVETFRDYVSRNIGEDRLLKNEAFLPRESIDADLFLNRAKYSLSELLDQPYPKKVGLKWRAPLQHIVDQNKLQDFFEPRKIAAIPEGRAIKKAPITAFETDHVDDILRRTSEPSNLDYDHIRNLVKIELSGIKKGKRKSKYKGGVADDNIIDIISESTKRLLGFKRQDVVDTLIKKGIFNKDHVVNEDKIADIDAVDEIILKSAVKKATWGEVTYSTKEGKSAVEDAGSIGDIDAADSARIIPSDEEVLAKIKADKWHQQQGVLKSQVKDNDHLAVVSRIMRGDPSKFMNGVIRYWQSVRGMNRLQIITHAGEFGMKITDKDIANAENQIRPKSKQWNSALTTSEGSDDNIESKIAAAYMRVKDRFSSLNTVTGMETDVDSYTFKKRMDDSGGYVMSLKDWYEEMVIDHGESYANKSFRAAAQFIAKDISEHNFKSRGKSGMSEIMLRNPEGSSEFVFVDNGMGRHTKDIVTDIFKRLSGRYESNPQNDARKFVGLIDRRLLVSDIDNASLSFVKNPDDIEDAALLSNWFKTMLNRDKPVVDGKKVSPADDPNWENRVILNYSSDRVKKAMVALQSEVLGTKERAQALEEVFKDSSIISDNLPGTAKADIETESDIIMGEHPKKRAGERAYRRNHSQDVGAFEGPDGKSVDPEVKRTIKETTEDLEALMAQAREAEAEVAAAKTELEKETASLKDNDVKNEIARVTRDMQLAIENPPSDPIDYITKDVDVTGIAEAKNDNYDDVWQRRMAREAESEGENKLSLLDKIKEKITGAKEFGGEVNGYLKKSLTVFEDIMRNKESELAITALRGDKGRITLRAQEMVAYALKPHYQKIFKDDGKNRQNRVNQFDRLQLFVREENMGALFENKMIGGELKPNWEKMLTEPIKNKADLNFNEWGNGAIKNMTAQSIVDNAARSKDSLFYAKYCVQELGVAPKDLVDLHVSLERNLYTPFRNYLEEVDVIDDVVERIKHQSFDKIDNYFRDHAPNFGDMEYISHTTKTDKEALTVVANKMDEIYKIERAKVKAENPGKTENELDALSVDFLDRWSAVYSRVEDLLRISDVGINWITHRVLSSPGGRKVGAGSREDTALRRKGKLNKLAKDKTLMAGEEALSTSKRDIRGRKVSTLAGLIKMGYNADISMMNVLNAQTKYALDQKLNVATAESMKKESIDRIVKGMEPVEKMRRDFIETREYLANGDPMARHNVLLKKGQAILDSADDYVRRVSDHAGMFYIVANADLAKIGGEIKKINEDFENPDITFDPKVAEAIQAKKKTLVNQMNLLQKIRGEYESPFAFTRALEETWTLAKKKGIITDEKFKTIERELASHRETIRIKLKNALFGNGTSGERDVYMPLNGKDYRDAAADEKVRKGREYLYAPDKRDINSGVKLEYGKYNRLSSPDVKGFEGLMVQRPLMKGFKDFIFRSDMSNKEDSLDVPRKVLKVYDKANMFMRNNLFFNPLILTSNDIAQSALSRNIFSKKSAKDQVFAHKAYQQKGDILTMGKEIDPSLSPGHFYAAANRYNLFDSDFGVKDLISENVRIQSEIFGDSVISYGLKAVLGDDAVADKSKIKSTLHSITKGYKLWQSATWAIDGHLRLAAAKGMYDKFLPMQEKKYGAGTPKAKQNAMALAVERTKLFLVDYSRSPADVKRLMNRFALTPNYKMQELRMYKEMSKDFKNGFEILIGRKKAADSKYQVSESNVRQAMWEMGPMLRKMIISAAIKSSAAAFFGYTADDGKWGWDTMNKLTNYRLSKAVKPNEPMNGFVKYMSLSTPMFTMEKYLSRDFRLTMRYQTAASLSVPLNLLMNQDRITGTKIFNRSDSMPVATAKAGLYTLQNIFPISRFVTDMANSLTKEDELGAARIINASGLGFFYKSESPGELMEEFKTAIDKSKTVGERKRASHNFYKGLDRATRTLMVGHKYRDMFERMAEAKEKINDEEF